MYVVRQEKFEGPLEVLLDLIEKDKLSITEISLAAVAEEYLNYVRKLEKIDPEQLAEFLVVAAQLMLIKSRSLLPSLKLSEEEEESVEEFERRLAEYQRIRERAKDLRSLFMQRHVIMTRESFQGMNPVFYPPPLLNSDRLASSFSTFLQLLPKIEKLAEEKIKKIISLEEKITHIRAMLSFSIERAFSELTRGAKEKIEVIVSFLALLELAKDKFLSLEQDKIFADIKIKKV